MRPHVHVKHAYLLPLLASLSILGACADAMTEEQPKPTRVAACSSDLEGLTMREGESSVASLLYACEGKDCRGSESFAPRATHGLRVEMLTDSEQDLWLESSAPKVFTLSETSVRFDPCSERSTVHVKMEARAAGTGFLTLRDETGELDRIAIKVAEPATLRFRVTPREQFAFETPPLPLEAKPGESWLILAELYDAEGELLVGSPPLTWTIDHPSVANLSEGPDSPDAALQTVPYAASVALLETRHVGETRVHAQSASIRATLSLLVARDARLDP